MPDIFQIADGNSINDFIERLTPLVQEFSRFRLAIAGEFAKAEAVLPRSEFGEVCRHFRLSYSTGHKLAKIANSDRVQQHRDQLQAVDSWSTLHAITTLKDEEFEAFKAEHLTGDMPVSVKRRDVERFKIGTCANRSGFSVDAIVQVDVSRIELADLFKVEEEVDDLEKRLSRFPAVHVAKKGLAQRLEVKLQAECGKAMNQDHRRREKIARRWLREVVNREIAKMPGPNKKARWLKKTGYSWDELFDPNIDPNEVLMEVFGYEPVDPELADVLEVLKKI